MIHMVFMKLREGILTEELLREYQETFDAIRRDLPEDVKSARVLRNCVDRAQNMDILIKMELRDESALPRYLRHPRHVAIGEKMAEHIVSLASFDCEE